MFATLKIIDLPCLCQCIVFEHTKIRKACICSQFLIANLIPQFCELHFADHQSRSNFANISNYCFRRQKFCQRKRKILFLKIACYIYATISTKPRVCQLIKTFILSTLIFTLLLSVKCEEFSLKPPPVFRRKDMQQLNKNGTWTLNQVNA